MTKMPMKKVRKLYPGVKKGSLENTTIIKGRKQTREAERTLKNLGK